jgi:hypothetical protein
MTRHLPLLVLLALVALLVVGCDKKTGTTTNAPATNGNKPAKSNMTPAPAGVPQKIKDMVDREWPKVEAAGAKFEEAFGRCKASMDAGNRPSQADITEASKAMNTLDGWAEIWNVVGDMEDSGELDAKSATMTKNFLGKYDSKVKGWTKKSKALKEFSTVK